MASGTYIQSVKNVLDRARALLNDQAGTLWTDDLLMPHVKSAYTFLSLHLAKADALTYEKVAGTPYTSNDLVYVANTTDITSICPADMWMPVKLEFRLSADDNWKEVDRVADLQFSADATLNTVPREWVWIDRHLYIEPVQGGGLIRLTYISLLPALTGPGSTLLADNAVEALGYFAAHAAYGSRGQLQPAQAMLGSVDPPSGALGFVDLLVQNLLRNAQEVPTRGKRFDEGMAGFGASGPWFL